jgi:spore germination protein KB
MKKEFFTLRQAIYTQIVFMIGSSVVMGVNNVAGQDSWIAFIVAVGMVAPLILIYSRIVKLFPEKDLYDIAIELFGKITGNIIIVLFTWYAIHLAAMVLRNFTEFVEISALEETPQTPIAIAIVLVAFYLARSGIKTFGKWSVIALFFVLFIILFTVIFSIKDMDFTNILPLMSHSFEVMFSSAFKSFSFPLAETVLFLALASSIKREDSPYKKNIYSILSGSVILMIIIIRNLLVLGNGLFETTYFPSYSAARIINVGDFLTRIEGSISFNFILAGLTKITVCILAGSKGIAKLFALRDHKNMILPVSLLILALSSIVFTSTMEMIAFINIYSYYAIPFQIIIPLITWITAEIKAKSKKMA